MQKMQRRVGSKILITVYVVSDHMCDDAGVDDTLKVFLDKDEAIQYQALLDSQHTSHWQFTSFEKREVIYDDRKINITDNSD